jgi:soluble lytic murein transglycosylase-like protein
MLLLGLVLRGFSRSITPAVSVPHTVSELSSRTEAVQSGFNAVEDLYRQRVRGVERFIYSRRHDARLARRIAWAVVLEADRQDLPVDLALGILLVENPEFKPSARSPVGATGLAQVMPFHSGKWKPCGKHLDDIEDNLCTGFAIFRHHLREFHGDTERALLAYNGCVRGTNTPDCQQYGRWVLEKLGRTRMELWQLQNRSD